MSRTVVTRTILAPVPRVFRTVSRIEHFAEAVPQIVNVEFLSEVTSGVGTRFRETRLMKGRESSTELEVREFEENRKIRIVSDSHGTVWDSIFSVAEREGGTELTLVMEARPHKLLPRLMVPLMKGMVAKALEADMDAVKAYCEEQEKG